MFDNVLFVVKLLLGIALILAIFALACVIVWATIAATIKTWNVLLGRDRFSWEDTVNWFRKLPRWAREGCDQIPPNCYKSNDLDQMV